MRLGVAAWRRARQELADFVTYFLLPLPGLLLPWRLAWPLYRRIAGRRWFFRSRVEAAYSEAERIIEIAEPQIWQRHYRLVQIVDLLDFWISVLQPWRWRRLLHQHGKWPVQRPLVIIGTHWGPAYFVLQSLHSAGIAPYYIIRNAPPGEFRGKRVLQLFTLARKSHLERLFPGKRYSPGGFPRRLIRALHSGECILALFDVPASRHSKHFKIRIFGRQAAVQSGIVGHAMDCKAMFVTYKLGLDFSTGRRILHIDPAIEHSNEEQALRHLADFMARTLEQDPAQWQLWQVANLFLG